MKDLERVPFILGYHVFTEIYIYICITVFLAALFDNVAISLLAKVNACDVMA